MGWLLVGVASKHWRWTIQFLSQEKQKQWMSVECVCVNRRQQVSNYPPICRLFTRLCWYSNIALWHHTCDVLWHHMTYIYWCHTMTSHC